MTMERDDIVTFPQVLGKRLQYARRLAGLSAKELAVLIGVGHQSVKRWECGMRGINWGSLRAAAEACNTTVSYLMGEEGYDEPFRRFTGEIPYRKLGRKPKKKA